MNIVGPIEWAPAQNAWLVSLRAITTLQQEKAARAEFGFEILNSNPNSYYYWARFARSHVMEPGNNLVGDCSEENPAAYNSSWEQVTGLWERKMYAAPDVRHCVTLWLRGPANIFHPENSTKAVFAAIWFKTPPRPATAQQSPSQWDTKGCFNHYPDRNAIRQCLQAKYGLN